MSPFNEIGPLSMRNEPDPSPPAAEPSLSALCAEIKAALEKATAALIASSPTWLSRLVAAVEEMEAERAEEMTWKERHDNAESLALHWQRQVTALRAKLADAEGANARMREEIVRELYRRGALVLPNGWTVEAVALALAPSSARPEQGGA